MVVQMAKAIGARVIATAGSPEKAAICRELGADHVIEYRSVNVQERIKELAPNGVNVWWETQRTPDFDLAVSFLSARGRMVLMAGREARPAFPVGPFYVKGCSLHGFAMFTYSAEEQRPCGEDINRWLSEGRLKARIDRVLPIEKASEAHAIQEASTLGLSGALAGKIVLKVA